MSLLDLIGLQRILHNGTELFRRKRINFVGGTVEDNAAADSTDVHLGGGEGPGGEVVGPESSTPGNLAIFAGEDGDELDDAGVAPTDLALTSDLSAAVADLVSGPADSAESELARFSDSTGKTIKRSTPKVHDDGRITGVTDPVDAQDVDTKGARDAAIASAGGWQILVDPNLTTESATTFADGTQSWIGLTWTGLNVAGNVDSFGVVPGTGLVLDHSAANSDWYLGINTAPRLYLPFSQIPNCQLGRTRVRLWAHMTGTGIDANYEAAKFGIETIPFVGNARRLWSMMLSQTDKLNVNTFDNNAEVAGNEAPNGSTARVGMIEIDTATLHVSYWSKVPTASAGDPNSAEFSMDSMRLVSSWRPAVGALNNLDVSRKISEATPANLCAVFGLQTVNTSNTAVAIWKRMRIEYRHD